jgi:predicted nucleic acid-binding protein
VIDTNVAVSAALLPRSVPRQAFNRALEHGTTLISSATVAELNDVLRRPRFDKYVHEDERLEFLTTFSTYPAEHGAEYPHPCDCPQTL